VTANPEDGAGGAVGGDDVGDGANDGGGGGAGGCVEAQGWVSRCEERGGVSCMSGGG
jgi:hypothetical protein